MNKKRIFIFIISIVLFSSLLYSQDKAFFYDIKNNGIKINLIEDYRTLVSGFSLYYDTGIASEPVNKKGITNIIKYLMFSKTKNLSTDEFMFFFFNIGGITDAVLTKDYMLLYDVFPSFYLDSILWLELERVNGLNFNREDFIRAKNLALEEYGTVSSKPLFNINNRIARLVYGKNSPYRIPTIGIKKDIIKISFKDIKDYYNKVITPNKLSVLLTGAYSINESFYKTRVFFGKIRPKRSHIIKQKQTSKFQPVKITISPDRYWYYVNVYNLGKPTNIKDYFIYKLFAEIFELSLKGYIITKLPAYSDFSTETIINKNGAFIKIILYSKRKIDTYKSVFLIDNIIKDIKKKTMDNQDFTIALNSFKSKLLNKFQYKSKKFKIFADIYNIFGKIYLEKSLLAIINRITKYEIYRYANKIFISGGRIEIKTK